jgi:hypothetical protein
MAHFTELVGARWSPIVESPTALRTQSGQARVVDIRFAYSIDSPHLELIEEAPGSVWELNAYSNIHHIGFWCGDSDLASESRRFGGAMCPVEVMGDDGSDDPALWAYHSDEQFGVRIELLHNDLRTLMQVGWDAAARAFEASS